MRDYHVHSNYSFDADFALRRMCRAALHAGITEICFTDHVDFDIRPPVFPAANLAARNLEIESLRHEFPALSIKRGVEIAIGGPACMEATMAHLENTQLDFIIASLHVVDGVDVYYPEYYDGKTLAEGYALYAERIAEYLPLCKDFSILGHYDFCAKYAPFPARAFQLSHASEAMDTALRYLAENGKGMEINTAAWRNDAPWGLDVLKRFVELGGEYITFGSDAHKPEDIGRRLKEAAALAKAAGLRYYASFSHLQPTLHPI